MIASLLLLSSVDWDFSQAAAFTCRTLRPLRSRMASKFVVFLPRISLALGRGAGNVTCHGITRSREAAPYEACQLPPPAPRMLDKAISSNLLRENNRTPNKAHVPAATAPPFCERSNDPKPPLPDRDHDARLWLGAWSCTGSI